MSDEYQILSGCYATEDNSAVIIQTSDFGDVAVSERDRPALWAKVQAWIAAGGQLMPYSEVIGEVAPAADEGMTIV